MKSSSIAFTAPHFASAQVGQHILESGGTAIEAMVAAAASIAVEYPHMNGLGGDGFWLISEPGKDPIAIDACGNAAQNIQTYRNLSRIPNRGPSATVTMAGAVAGWQKALEISEQWQPTIPLSELFDTAIRQAEWGIEVTQSLSSASMKTFDELSQDPHFSCFLIKGKALKKGKILKLKALANTLKTLAKNGLNDFYHGDIAQKLVNDLQLAGSALTIEDFQQYSPALVHPLKTKISAGTLFNLPAPTQGIASLIILALFDRLKSKIKNEVDFVHYMVECTKQAFIVRDKWVTDPTRIDIDLTSLLDDHQLNKMLDNIDPEKALDWPYVAKKGDTIWMGACDQEGRMVSYIQSLYWEFGSGVVSPSTGIVWNNRGTSFSLQNKHLNELKAGLKPFHTLNPAFALLDDGSRMCYGTMGGEGQPQTQAAIFARHIMQGIPLERSISLGRWLLGRTWGDESNNLKIERDLYDLIGNELIARGHDVQVVEACNELMGHAGAIVQLANGETEAASDPRSDGKAFSDCVAN